jgi:N-dimethylarginine dimethylaminohydrolase
MTHTLLMGDPTHFSIVGGANPHTRDRYGLRKRVNRALAIRQWQRLHDLLRDHGLRIEAVPPDPTLPGLVYPANAGFRIGEDFILSNLTPTRAAEQPIYHRVVESLGLRCHRIQSRFEGEADLFPARDLYVFTHGRIRRQRFAPRLGWPPWTRIYGFRSEPVALDEIEAIHPVGRTVLQLLLRDERYYHGDTCLCSFGPDRRALLAYLPALAAHSTEALRHVFGEQLVALADPDAEIYAANSFHFEREGESFLVMPEGISASLEEAVSAQDTRVLKIDVSEFHKKGGGSVKCMLGDLGEIP